VTLHDYRTEVLTDVPGLTDVPPAMLAGLAREFDIRDHDHTMICLEGEPADVLFILAEGECEVIKTAPNGKKYKVAVLTSGCLFGQVGVMTLAHRTASVQARGRVRTLQMPARRARELLRNGSFQVTSPFRRALIVALARQLQSATATTMKLAVDAGLSVPAADSPGPTVDDMPTTEQTEDLLRANSLV
jgi:CRP-like cAMP-binding protein